MSRLRHTVVLFLLGLVAVGLAGCALADPFHLRYVRWFTAGAVLLAILLLTAALAVAVARRLLRGFVLVLGGVAVVGWVAVVLLASQLVDEGAVVMQSVDGNRRLVVVEGDAFAIDPIYAVVLRSGGGPLEQESLVYQGREEGPAPAAVRFVDAADVEVDMGAGCRYRSRVEGVTLAVDPVHRPLTPTTC